MCRKRSSVIRTKPDEGYWLSSRVLLRGKLDSSNARVLLIFEEMSSSHWLSVER